ncbi:MAG: hypothetical protein JWM27_4005 [Gemmatimonadetes bacterium]|nr:hypothetical protein [Gemmatimonadota bacterium]
MPIQSSFRRALRGAVRSTFAAGAVVLLTAARSAPARPHVPATALELPAVVAEDPTGTGWPTALLNGIALTPAQRQRLEVIRAAYAGKVSFEQPAAGDAQTISWAARLQLRLDQRNAIRAVLSPQQRTIFDANAERVRDRVRIRTDEVEKERPSRFMRLLRMLRFSLG